MRRDGKYLFADTGNRRILEVSADGKTRVLIGPEFGLGTPAAAVEGPDGGVFVSDVKKSKIFIYTADAVSLLTLETTIEIHQPYEIDIRNNQLFVANSGGGEIAVLGLK